MLEKNLYDQIVKLSEEYDKTLKYLYTKQNNFTSEEQELFNIVSSQIIDIDRILMTPEYRTKEYVIPLDEIKTIDIDKFIESKSNNNSENSDNQINIKK